MSRDVSIGGGIGSLSIELRRGVGVTTLIAEGNVRAVPDPRILEQELLAMARIKFKPVCSACSKIIYDVIDCGYIRRSTSKVIYRDFDITPAVCPNCGKPFEGIEMPTELPYDNTFEIRWRNDDW